MVRLLEDAIRDLQERLSRKGVRLHSVSRDSISSIRVDRVQARRALGEVLRFCRSLLPQGGEVEIEAAMVADGAERYVELRLVGYSSVSARAGGGGGCEPFLELDGYRIGLNAGLAREVLRRRNGRVRFQRQDPVRGLFPIRLKAHAGRTSAWIDPEGKHDDAA